MTPQEFQSAFFQIESRWKRAHNADQVALIHAVADKYTFEQFKTVCTRLLGSMRSAPMVPDFERAFSEMRFVPRGNVNYSQSASVFQSEQDFYYQLEENVFADNKFIHVRDKDTKKCSFIIKADHPNHPLVQLDAQLRKEKIAEIKKQNEEIFRNPARVLQNLSFAKTLPGETA
jgi:hypothetical protein